MSARGPSAASNQSGASVGLGPSAAAGTKASSIPGIGVAPARSGAAQSDPGTQDGSADARPAQHFSSALAAANQTSTGAGKHAAAMAPRGNAGKTATAGRAVGAASKNGPAPKGAAAPNATANPSTNPSASIAANGASAADVPAASKTPGKSGKVRSASDDAHTDSSQLAVLAILLGAGSAAVAAVAGRQTGPDIQSNTNDQASHPPMTGVEGGGANATGNARAATAATTATAATDNGVAKDLAASLAHSPPTILTDANMQSKAAPSAGAASMVPQLLQQLADVSTVTSATARIIALPVSDPRWPQAVAAQVTWLANNQIQSATLHLSPEHLGPLEVHIDLQQSQINVSFHASHPDTRNALAAAVPGLRELFAAGGLTLGQATVQQEPHSQAQSHGAAARQGPIAETVEPVSVAASHVLGLVDEYA